MRTGLESQEYRRSISDEKFGRCIHVMKFHLALRSPHGNIAGAVLLSPPADPQGADPHCIEVIGPYYGRLDSTDKDSSYGLVLRNGPISIQI